MTGGGRTRPASPVGELRLFVACAVPGDVRSHLAGVLDRRRRRLAAARWVPAENWHLTLAFLGAVAAAQLPGLDRHLAAACARLPAFRLQLAAPGTFPPARPARVAWIGLEVRPPGGAALLGGLQEAVVDAVVTALGAAAETSAALLRERRTRGFHPHLTLARMDPPWDLAASSRFSAVLGADLGAEPRGPAFGVAEVVLVASELGSGPVHHRVLSRYPLAATQPAAAGDATV